MEIKFDAIHDDRARRIVELIARLDSKTSDVGYEAIFAERQTNVHDDPLLGIFVALGDYQGGAIEKTALMEEVSATLHEGGFMISL